MATARRTGTSESVSTYGAGQTYTALATWESATDNDNVAGTVSPVLECLAAEYDDTVLMAGATNNATYFRIIRPQPNNFHEGKRDTGVRFYSTADVDGIVVAENNSSIQDVVARVTNNSASGRITFIHATAGAGVTFIGCIATASSNAGAGANQGIQLGFGTTSIAVDCLSENNDSANCIVSGTIVIGTFYNCTAYGTTSCFNAQGATNTLDAVNCLGFRTSGAVFVSTGTMTGDYNASNDATAVLALPGTNSRINQTFDFWDTRVGDYALTQEDTGARNFGTDLSADATFPFDDDLRRALWATWDIGCLNDKRRFLMGAH